MGELKKLKLGEWERQKIHLYLSLREVPWFLYSGCLANVWVFGFFPQFFSFADDCLKPRSWLPSLRYATAGAVGYWVILPGRGRKCSRAIWTTRKELIIFLTRCCWIRWLWPAVARLPKQAILLREHIVLHPLLDWFSPLLLKMWFLAQPRRPHRGA